MTTPIALANALADSELVQSTLAGRDSGFEELVRRYQRPIAAYVYRMKARAKIRALLDADQQKKFDALVAQQDAEHNSRDADNNGKR